MAQTRPARPLGSPAIRINAMFDIHCHMLPAVDDGATDWETAEAMARIAAGDGIKHVVCTPHANDRYVYDRAAHQARVDEFTARMDGRITFSLGCDFHFSFENITDALASPDRYLISGSDYLLVEFSDFSLAPQTLDTLRRFLAMGITPIVTHPERNPILQRTPNLVLQMVEVGCAVQVTANSLTGHWGENSRRVCHWLLDREAVHIVASDAHDTRHRPPVLSPAVRHISSAYGKDRARALTTENPAAVVHGSPLPYFPPPVRG